MLLNVDKGRYYNLNRVGSRIWAWLESPRTIGEMCEQLQSDFDVSPEVCRRDVIEHVSLLIAEGLASVVASEALGTDERGDGHAD